MVWWFCAFNSYTLLQASMLAATKYTQTKRAFLIEKLFYIFCCKLPTGNCQLTKTADHPHPVLMTNQPVA